MKSTLTTAQIRRLERAIARHIRKYAQCRRRLSDLDAATYTLGLDCFGSELALVSWLCTPASALNGKAPLQQLGTIKGRAIVTNLLLAIQYSVFQ